MQLPQDFEEIVCQSEDAAVSNACICLANIIRLLKLKYIAIILHSFYFFGIFYSLFV